MDDFMALVRTGDTQKDLEAKNIILKYKPQIDNLKNAEIVNYSKIPTDAIKLGRNGKEWEIRTLVNLNEPLDIPADKFRDVMAAVNSPIPFSRFVIQHELKAWVPTFRPIVEAPRPAPKKLDPALYGIIITDWSTMTGWWVCLAQWGE